MHSRRSPYRHPRRGRFPHQGDFFRRQAVGFVDKVADFVFQLQSLGDEGAGRLDGSGVFLSEVRQRGRRQGLLLPAYLLDLSNKALWA